MSSQGLRHPRARSRLGVLGGMGPRATVDFLGKVVDLTRAQRDQDHLSLVLYSCPEIPDRSEALLRGGPSPLPMLQGGLRLLEDAGATQIAVPCNTAHWWLPSMRQTTRVQILSILDAVIEALRRKAPDARKVAILGTEATVRSGLYSEVMAAAGFDVVLPNDADQAAISNAIRLTKEGRAAELHYSLDTTVGSLSRAGATVCVLACTELSLIRFSAYAGTFIDSTHALAEHCVRVCLGPETTGPNRDAPFRNAGRNGS